MTEAMQLVLVGAAIGFAGGALGTLVTFLMARGTRKSEERRHFVELVVKAGVENWKIISETTAKDRCHANGHVHLIHGSILRALF
jgi:hypothetical protein